MLNIKNKIDMFWKKEKKEKKQKKNVVINISTDRCSGCGKCFLSCRNGAFEIKYGYSYWAYPFDCVGCGKCAAICTNNAIQIIQKPEILQPITISI
jgi:NAD-dependent dihydropyrimidine dehydrogenase PreA subunit